MSFLHLDQWEDPALAGDEGFSFSRWPAFFVDVTLILTPGAMAGQPCGRNPYRTDGNFLLGDPFSLMNDFFLYSITVIGSTVIGSLLFSDLRPDCSADNFTGASNFSFQDNGTI